MLYQVSNFSAIHDEHKSHFYEVMMSASFDYSASSLKQQCAGRHVATLRRIILNLGQQTPYLAKKQQIPILSSLVLININVDTCSFKTTDLCLSSGWQKFT
jgi:transaldolase